MKPIWQSRTIWFNVLTAAATVIGLPEVHALLGPDALHYVLMASSVCNVVLRFLTTTPITAKVS